MLLILCFLAVVTALTSVMLFHPPSSAWLQARDDAIRSKPVPEYFRDSWLLRQLYPSTRKSKMPPADKVLICVILFGVVLVIYEIGTILSILPEDESMIAYATCFLVLIFVFEFVLRFWMKGFAYMLPWGGIDLLVILVDFATIIIFFDLFASLPFGKVLSVNSPEGAAVLRLLRVARLFRSLKLVRYAFEKQRRVLFWRSVLPHVKALLGLTLIILTIVFLFGCVISIARSQSPIEGWKAIISQVFNNLGGGKGSEPFALAAAVLIIAAIANMIAIFYAPIMERIRIEQRSIENLDLLEGHVIVCLNDADKYEGFLEELFYVFNRSADRQVFMLEDGAEDIDLSGWQNISKIRGDKQDPGTWRRCAASSADALVLLGTHDLLKESDFHNFMCPGGRRTGGRAVIFNIVNEGEGYLRKQLGPHADIIQIQLDSLIQVIERNAWRRNSLQFAYLHKLTDEFEDVVEFPDLSAFSGQEEAAEIFRGLLQEALGIEVVRRGNNLLLDLTSASDASDDVPEELLEFRRLETVISAINQHPNLASESCVFAYVAAFELIDRNADLSNNPDAHLSVFAIEFAAALSLFHELISPGVLKGWFSNWDDVANVNEGSNITFTALQKRQRLMSPEGLAKRLALSDEQTVVGLLDAEGKLTVTTRSSNRFGKNKSDYAIVLSAPPQG
ncbi:ion transporter [Poseidonocella sedimentorum]|uniref:Ion transport protein n=1 Tax=Poseidonocella sedimentorum TaxID=871652 RepID=A0A1I6DYS9_9RHOB|nr:ion transporter [Poseidonocella sedimentorum]SFR10438.1 Ion transport protein [Poseidonocella sedimentorum]